jgi:hypothetical protein
MQTWLLVADVALLAHGATSIRRRALPDASPAEAAAYTVALAVSVAILLATVLAALRSLRPFMVTGILALLVLVIERIAGPSPRSRRDPLQPRFDVRGHWPLLLPAVLFLPHLTRSMAAPPRAWDALTYHLPRAANWVIDGGFVPHLAPDAGRYYEFYSPGGDLVFAFALLAASGDAPLYFAYAGIMAAILLGTYTFARTLGANVLDASLATAVVGTMPCVLQLSASAYVDGFVLALVLLGLTFAVRAAQTAGSGRYLVVTLMTAGTAAAAKNTGLPLLAMCGLLSIVLAYKGRAGRWPFLGGCVLAVIPVGTWMLYTAVHTGSPIYPFGLRIGTWELASGNELLRRTFDNSLTSRFGGPRDLIGFVSQLFVGTSQIGVHLNWGVGAAIALVLGLGTALPQRKLPRGLVLFLLLVAALPVVSVMVPSAIALRTRWAPFTGRLLAPTVAIAACLAASASTRLTRLGLGVALMVALPTALPAGMTLSEFSLGVRPIAIATTWMLAWLAPFLLRRRRYTRKLLLAAAALASPLFCHALVTSRAVLRPAYYRSLGEGTTFEFHPVPIHDQSALWQSLDGERPERIVYTSGFRPPGQHWFRYPLYGSRLQNRVLYIPATRSGAIPDHGLSATPAELCDADTYADRLVREHITALVIHKPMPPEVELARSRPDRFALLRASSLGTFEVYRPLPRGALPPDKQP